MLLPDNINPKLSIYYNSSVLLAILNEKKIVPIIDLFEDVKNINKISFSTFIFCLDWLYLIETAIILDDGRVKLCTLESL